MRARLSQILPLAPTYYHAARGCAPHAALGDGVPACQLGACHGPDRGHAAALPVPRKKEDFTIDFIVKWLQAHAVQVSYEPEEHDDYMNREYNDPEGEDDHDHDDHYGNDFDDDDYD